MHKRQKFVPLIFMVIALAELASSTAQADELAASEVSDTGFGGRFGSVTTVSPSQTYRVNAAYVSVDFLSRDANLRAESDIRVVTSDAVGATVPRLTSVAVIPSTNIRAMTAIVLEKTKDTTVIKDADSNLSFELTSKESSTRLQAGLAAPVAGVLAIGALYEQVTFKRSSTTAGTADEDATLRYGRLLPSLSMLLPSIELTIDFAPAVRVKDEATGKEETEPRVIRLGGEWLVGKHWSVGGTIEHEDHRPVEDEGRRTTDPLLFGTYTYETGSFFTVGFKGDSLSVREGDNGSQYTFLLEAAVKAAENVYVRGEAIYSLIDADIELNEGEVAELTGELSSIALGVFWRT